ncbi:MAG: hypothetical protein GEV28_20415 [Actinophytocola sp.]|uniref:hypothetical protein n=1 Tax=Actinophytocola sp. TaxID=1872138 RepID=UPI001322327D|nr:hypothetical protein [Actinophytocola sp.]MPZ82630.1 hypothetical protein [Actinophytocola sp.]
MAADLIDAYLQAEPIHPDQSHRLRHVRFPAALEWLHTEDVIRLAPSWAGEAASRRAFFSRWPTRADFLPDAVVYTLLREQDDDPHGPAVLGPSVPVSRLVIGVADELLADLVRHPRSYLVLHLGPLLPRHPQLSGVLLPGSRAATSVWLGIYRRLAHGLDLVMRPEWTFKRMSTVLQAMLDGFVLRHRVQPDDQAAARWKGASLLADAIIAFLLGAVDWDLTGQPGRTALDLLTRPQPRLR